MALFTDNLPAQKSRACSEGSGKATFFTMQKLLPYVKNIRRELHANAEVSGLELVTQKIIMNELEGCFFKSRAIETGVVCDIVVNKKDKNFIGIRCDTDALPVTEKNDVYYKSKTDAMHACGHDGHMAIVLGLAKHLSFNPPDKNVRLIFQFGEEGYGGAQKMIAEGAAKNLTEIYALHLSPEYDKGCFATNSGAIFAGSIDFDIIINGKSAHCAMPQSGVDAIKKAGHFLHLFDTLNQKYKNNTLLAAGKINGGVATNVIADRVTLSCTLRYFDILHSEHIFSNISNALNSIDNLLGGTHSIIVHDNYIPLINNSDCVNVIKKTIPNVLECLPKYTAEDFAFFADTVPACLTWLGIRDEKHFAPLHSDTFDFDDDVLIKGVEFFDRIIRSA